MLTLILGVVNGFMRALSGLLQWFREKDIHDAGVNAEKVRQRETQDDAVSRANRAALDPAKLRDNKYKRPPKDY